MKNTIFPLVAIVVLGAFTVADDVDTISKLRDQLTAFNAKYKRAKLDLQFNQPKYALGDTAWVRTLYLSATDLKAVPGSQLIHVEVYNREGKRVMRTQLLSKNGYSENGIPLPSDLEPGIYKLVAYSDWMKNLDSSLFFSTDLIITGKQSLEPDSPAVLEVYPEGGSLVAGVLNNLLIHASASPAALVNLKGPNGVISTVVLDDQGLGQVTVTPVGDTHYEIELDSKKQIRTSLPEPIASGFALEVSPALEVSIVPSPNVDNKANYHLAVINSSGILFSKALEVHPSTPLMVSLPAELPGGVAQVVIVDENLNRLAWRTVNISRKASGKISVHISKSVFSTRETVKIEIEAADQLGNPLPGQFELNVVNKSLFSKSVAASTAENLLLYSDIAGTFRLKGILDEAQVNRYLISQDCPWISFRKIPAVLAYGMNGTLVINGTANFVETGLPVGDSTLMMFFLQKQTAGYEVYTNKSGVFSCPILFDFSGEEQIFYSATRKGSDLHNVAVRLTQSDSAYSFRASGFKAGNVEDPYGSYEVKRNLISQSYSYFSKKKDRTDSLYDPNAVIEDELQGADMVLKVSDYVVFPTMVDLVREVLRSVEYRKIRGRDVVRVYTTGKRPTNDAGPLYVIDGVLTKNAATFMGLKPADIITIKLIKDSNKLRKFGSLGANGVLLVRTKNATKKAALLQEDSFAFEGIAPRLNTKRSAYRPSLPDLRPALFWAPQLKFDAAGKATIEFTTSDDVGTFEVDMQGLSDRGTIYSAKETFEVKFNPQQ